MHLYESWSCHFTWASPFLWIRSFRRRNCPGWFREGWNGQLIMDVIKCGLEAGKREVFFGGKGFIWNAAQYCWKASKFLRVP